MPEESELEPVDNLARVLELAQPSRPEDPAEAAHRVIDQCLVSMVFQPIVDLKRGEIFAYEALCRSRVPQFDNPPALIEAATSIGRIGELGRLQRHLASKNCPDWPIFINISPNEFDEGFLVRPDDAIFRHRKPVYVEITESVPLVFFEQCHSVLAELRRKGARLAIDDLGAGYSNLKYIADLAPDIVKLDRDLVAGCTMEGTQYELLCSIAKLCREVNAQVVAEGVETEEELEAVGSAGIEYCQGYFLGRPKISPSELTWPGSELVASEGFQLRRTERLASRSEPLPEDADRRLGELEDVRAMLEKSVRKARGEVVRLRKALGQAEGKSERARTRLAEMEDSLTESETNRRRLARLFEAATLKKLASEPQAEPSEAPPPSKLKRIAGHALIAAAGLVAGLTLYFFDPRTEELRPEVDPVQAAVQAPATAPDQPEAVRFAEPAARVAVEPPVAAVVPAPLPAAPVTVPVADPTPARPEQVQTSAPSAQQEIRAAVLDWAAAWSAQDVDLYVGHYTNDFVAENGLSGESWRAHRRDRLTSPRFIRVRIDELEVNIEGASMARVEFKQSYESDTWSDETRKSLNLVREGGRWRIVKEVALS